MNPSESATNMIVALINQDRLATAEQVADAYKTVYAAVISPSKS